MSERSGTETDHRPECRGVRLDRGELDTNLERAVTQPPCGMKRQESWLSEILG